MLDSLLFSLALAVGLTPQLLPAIISINLSHGAKRMAAEKVIVKRLAVDRELRQHERAVHRQDRHADRRAWCSCSPRSTWRATPSDKVLLYAYLNATYRDRLRQPDRRGHPRAPPVSTSRATAKLDEVPYDFLRKRLSILVAARAARTLMVTKGALANVLAVCTTAETRAAAVVDLATRAGADPAAASTSSARKGFRALASPAATWRTQASIGRADEADMTFLGFLRSFDPPKPGIVADDRRA